MNPDFWISHWKQNKIGFHQSDVNRHLQNYFPTLEAPAGSRVLVPLCGKSLDMIWLRDQGYRVLGVEVSEVAVESFFAENGLVPEKETHGKFLSYRSGDIEILLGNFFSLRRIDLADVSCSYDRAALVALPEEMRVRYARTMSYLPSGSRALLLTIEYPQDQLSGPPFSVPESEIRSIFSDEFDVQLLYTADILEKAPRFKDQGVTALTEKVLLLERH